MDQGAGRPSPAPPLWGGTGRAPASPFRTWIPTTPPSIHDARNRPSTRHETTPGAVGLAHGRRSRGGDRDHHTPRRFRAGQPANSAAGLLLRMELLTPAGHGGLRRRHAFRGICRGLARPASTRLVYRVRSLRAAV